MVIQGFGLPDRYAVIGHPVAHSRSPLVHRCFAEQTNELVTYARIDATPEAFVATVKDCGRVTTISTAISRRSATMPTRK